MENKSYEVIINGVGKNVTRKEDKDVIEKIFNNYKTDSLILRTVGQICESQDNFYIANYQRGYRWGKDEVEALLDDIYEVYKKDDNEQKYCLQPLVVKKKERVKYTYALKNLIEKTKNIENGDEFLDSSYELLDGQQRLTTLWLILSELKEVAQNKRNYHIYYELLRPVDKAFIDEAIRIISEWLSKKEKQDSKFNKIAFWQTICERLTFVWYEVADKRNLKDNVVDNGSEELFRKINKGKIELTNAELFKAMLLNGEGATEQYKSKLEQIAFEWDKIEQSLSNDDFWYFLFGNAEEEHTRIDYILEVYAKGVGASEKYDSSKDRYSFLVVQAQLENELENLSKSEKNNGQARRKIVFDIWLNIVNVHDKLYSWYQDNELYHNIGFLVACEGKRRAVASEVVVDLYKKNKDASIKDLQDYVKQKIYDKLIVKSKGKQNRPVEFYDLDEVDYHSDKQYIRSFLLYSNIYPLLQCSESRFPFKEYYKEHWDIEHINPQTPNIKIEDTVSWIEPFIRDKYGKTVDDESIEKCKKEIERELKRNYDVILRLLKQEQKIKKQDDEKAIVDRLKPLQEKWASYIKSETEAEKNQKIGNLVLLDDSSNRGYQNALFNQKRCWIVSRDERGEFVMLQTRRVFLKFYSLTPDYLYEWTDDDAKAYQSDLKRIFSNIKQDIEGAES